MNHHDRIAFVKELVYKVVDEMTYADSDVKKIARKYFTEIVVLSSQFKHLGKKFSFSVNKSFENEVLKILERMKAELFELIYTRSLNASRLLEDYYDYEEDEEGLLAFLSSDINGETLVGRIDGYVTNISKEFETYAALGIGKGLSEAETISEYMANIKHPYQSQSFREAITDNESEAERIKSKGISFGIGKIIAAYSGLKFLEQDTIYKAYNNSLFNIWRGDSNIIGWYTVRGSNFLCPNVCDPQVGVFHPITESYFGYHTRCVCPAIPVYKTDL